MPNMVNAWLRRTLRRCGFDVSFRDVVCPEDLKSIAVDADMRTTVTVRRTLVFLERPEAGDLRDAIPVDPGCDPTRALYESPDAIEIARSRRGATALVSWKPRDTVTPFALYSHQYAWHPSGKRDESALYTEIQCDMRTGFIGVEMLTPGVFETAVIFRRPRWRRLGSEMSVIKYALRQLDGATDRPTITHGGKRVEWKLVAPKVGDRYLCVVFHQHGVALWERRLKEMSFMGRLRQLIRPLIPA